MYHNKTPTQPDVIFSEEPEHNILEGETANVQGQLNVDQNADENQQGSTSSQDNDSDTDEEPPTKRRKTTEKASSETPRESDVVEKTKDLPPPIQRHASKGKMTKKAQRASLPTSNELQLQSTHSQSGQVHQQQNWANLGKPQAEQPHSYYPEEPYGQHLPGGEPQHARMRQYYHLPDSVGALRGATDIDLATLQKLLLESAETTAKVIAREMKQREEDSSDNSSGSSSSSEGDRSSSDSDEQEARKRKRDSKKRKRKSKKRSSRRFKSKKSKKDDKSTRRVRKQVNAMFQVKLLEEAKKPTQLFGIHQSTASGAVRTEVELGLHDITMMITNLGLIIGQLEDIDDAEIRKLRAKEAKEAVDTCLKNIEFARSFAGIGSHLNLFRKHTESEVRSIFNSQRFNKPRSFNSQGGGNKVKAKGRSSKGPGAGGDGESN